MVCLCGCGEKIKKNSYKRGHRKNVASKLCLCGCGNLAKSGFSFIWGHNGKFINHKGRVAWNKGLTKETDERVKKGVLANKEYLDNYDIDLGKYVKVCLTCEKQIITRNREKKYCSIGCIPLRGFTNSKNDKSSFESKRREGISKALKGRSCSEERKEKLRKYFSDPENRKKNSEMVKRFYEKHPEALESLSDSMAKLWQKPGYVRKQMKSRNVNQNKLEKYFGEIIEDFGFKFVGDGRMIIGGKCPDFCNGDRKLIELYGDYWHRDQDPQERIDLFKQYGYDALVIWEHEIRPEKLFITTNRIRDFVKE